MSAWAAACWAGPEFSRLCDPPACVCVCVCVYVRVTRLPPSCAQPWGAVTCADGRMLGEGVTDTCAHVRGGIALQQERCYWSGCFSVLVF